jgi:hypothetical protein
MKLLRFDGPFTATRLAALMDHLIDSVKADPEARARGPGRPTARKRRQP